MIFLGVSWRQVRWGQNWHNRMLYDMFPNVHFETNRTVLVFPAATLDVKKGLKRHSLYGIYGAGSTSRRRVGLKTKQGASFLSVCYEIKAHRDYNQNQNARLTQTGARYNQSFWYISFQPSSKQSGVKSSWNPIEDVRQETLSLFSQTIFLAWDQESLKNLCSMSRKKNQFWSDALVNVAVLIAKYSLGILSKDDGNGDNNARKQWSDWMNEENNRR